MGDDDAWIRQLSGVRSQSGAEKRAEAGGEAPARRRAGVERGDDKTAGKIVRAGSSAVSKLHLMLLNITQLPEAWTLQDRHSRESGNPVSFERTRWVPLSRRRRAGFRCVYLFRHPTLERPHQQQRNHSRQQHRHHRQPAVPRTLVSTPVMQG